MGYSTVMYYKCSYVPNLLMSTLRFKVMSNCITVDAQECNLLTNKGTFASISGTLNDIVIYLHLYNNLQTAL